jgi:hypothetical protein
MSENILIKMLLIFIYTHTDIFVILEAYCFYFQEGKELNSFNKSFHIGAH